MQPIHLLLIFSILFILLGVIMIRKANRLLRVGRRTTATVIKNHYSSDSDGGTTYTPVVEFHTENKETITMALSYSTGKPTYVGKRINIIYDPANPRQVEVNSIFTLFLFPWLFMIIGVAGLVLSCSEFLGITNMIMTE